MKKTVTLSFRIAFLIVFLIFSIQQLPAQNALQNSSPQSSREMWDLQFAYEMPGMAPPQAIIWDGSYFYMAGFGSPDLHQFDAAGNYIGCIQIPGISSFRDFAWDGSHLYACNGTPVIYEIDINAGLLISTINVPISPRVIAYDHGQDAFWIGDWTTQLLLVDKSGMMLNSYAMTEQIFGMDYDGFSESGQYLWLLGNNGSGFRYFQMDVGSGQLTGEQHYIGEDFGYEFTTSGLFVENDIIEGKTTIGGLLSSEPPQFFGYELYGGGGPQIELSHDSLYQQLYPEQTTTQSFYIYNTGDSDLTYDVEVGWGLKSDSQFFIKQPLIPVRKNKQHIPAEVYRSKATIKNSEIAPGFTPGPIQQSEDLWDVYFELPCAIRDGEAGAESDGTYLYTTKWNGPEFYKYDYQGNFIETFTIDGVSNVRDLAHDGTYFYGAAANTTLFEMDFDNKTLISIINAPVAVRAVASVEYTGEDGFWANNWSDDPTKFDRQGAVLNSFSLSGDESFYGFAVINNHLGLLLYGFSQSNSGILLKEYSLPDGTWTKDFDLATVLELPHTGDIAGGLFYCWDQYGMMFLGGLVQNVCLWGLEIMQYPLGYDCSVQQIISPQTGPYLSSEEFITVEIRNSANQDVSGCPVFAILDGDTIASDIIEEVIPAETSIEFTFDETIDLSIPGLTYILEVCTALWPDEIPINDCKSVSITNTWQNYCPASTGYEVEFISHVLCGEIDNTSEWQGGVADYTDMSAALMPGNEKEITVSVDDSFADDVVYVWIDWNNNYDFDGDDEEFQLSNIGGSGNVFTGNIFTPGGVNVGAYRMRIRLVYNEQPMPCGIANYGEVEEYTIHVTSQFPEWIEIISSGSGVIAPGDSALVEILYDAQYAFLGMNEAVLSIENNSPENPVTLPVILEVISQLLPPQNLQAEVINRNDVQLSWEAPVNRDLLYYKIYRNSMAFDSIDQLEYLDENLAAGTYTYVVTAMYDYGESEPSNQVTVFTTVQPDMTFQPDSFYFVTAPPFIPETKYLTIQNTGNITLEAELETIFYLGLKEMISGEWLQLSADVISIPPDSTLIIEIICDASDIIRIGSYFAAIGIESNDPDLLLVEIPVTLDVAVGIEGEILSGNNNISILPNPASGQVTISSRQLMKQITILAVEGEELSKWQTQSRELRIDVSGFVPGIYLVKVETSTSLHLEKLVVHR